MNDIANNDSGLKIVLLPGLDGTGLLFGELISALPDKMDITTISLDDLDGASYTDQAVEISKQLQNCQVLLVAESYSGRIAYELCGILGEKLRGVVFLASFISPPSLISKVAYMLPLALLKPYRINRWLLKNYGFSGKGEQRLISRVFESISRADKTKLKRRLHNIATLAQPSKSYSTPTTYIHPQHDHLVSQHAIQVIRNLFPNNNIVSILGGHFIAQSNPEECANSILDMTKD